MTLPKILSRITHGPEGVVWPALWNREGNRKAEITSIDADGCMLMEPGYYRPLFTEWDKMDHYWIIAKSFDTLCEEVESDPVDNAAVRAFGDGFAKVYPDCISIHRPGLFIGTIKPDWDINRHNEHIVSLPGLYNIFQSLIAQGYAVGLSEVEYVEPKDVEYGNI